MDQFEKKFPPICYLSYFSNDHSSGLFNIFNSTTPLYTVLRRGKILPSGLSLKDVKNAQNVAKVLSGLSEILKIVDKMVVTPYDKEPIFDVRAHSRYTQGPCIGGSSLKGITPLIMRPRNGAMKNNRKMHLGIIFHWETI